MLKNPLIQEWEVNPLAKMAYDMWRVYYEACELFDEIVCSGRMGDGTPIGVNTTERHRSSQYAKTLYNIMLRSALDEGIDEKLFFDYKWTALSHHETILGRKFP